MNEDGTMSRLSQLQKLSDEQSIKMVTVSELISYRRRTEKLVHRVAEAKLPTKYGEFTIIAYKSDVDADEQVALVMGDTSGDEPVLVRVHSECLTGDVFGSMRCDCGEQIELGMKAIAKEGRGVFIYMRQEGRGIGFHNKIRAYALQDQGLDTVEANLSLGYPADLRDYGIGAQIMADLKLKKIRLLTNNPKKVISIEGHGLEVVQQVPIVTVPNPYNRRYLETKKTKMGHLLEVPQVGEN
jgi:3,4-dihydroxy 2-butanone 4-phosphate synthase/GTP cyclohydrolase II